MHAERMTRNPVCSCVVQTLCCLTVAPLLQRASVDAKKGCSLSARHAINHSHQRLWRQTKRSLPDLSLWLVVPRIVDRRVCHRADQSSSLPVGDSDEQRAFVHAKHLLDACQVVNPRRDLATLP